MPARLIKPKALTPKSQIGIVSPARWAMPEVISTGKKMLENMGYSVFVHPQNQEKDFQLAGSDEARADAIMDLFEDPSIDAILAPRGGIGSYRLIPHLKWDVIAANPKIFCGFSDLTTLLIAMHQRTGLVTFHGPLLMNFFGDHEPYNLEYMLKALSGHPAKGETVHYGEARSITDGKAEGRIIGGNITLLQHLIATKDDFNTDGAILFIEDEYTSEKISDIDRKLWHFKNAKKFDRIAALIVGDYNKFREDSYGQWKHEIPSLLKELVPPHIPVCYNFPCAHGRKITTLPIGVQASLEISAKGAFLTLLESPFA